MLSLLQPLVIALIFLTRRSQKHSARQAAAHAGIANVTAGWRGNSHGDRPPAPWTCAMMTLMGLLCYMLLRRRINERACTCS